MDAKKETRHFVRDRCNFNKKKRIKYITIGLVISVLNNNEPDTPQFINCGVSGS